MGALRAPLLAALALLALALLALASAAHAYALGPGTAQTPRDPLVAMQVDGGFTGGSDYLAIGRHGTGRLDNRQGSRLFRVSASRMRALRSALRHAHWQRLRADYRAPRPVADGLHYTILYASRAVRTEDGARRPRRLERVLDLLTRIAERHGGFL